MPGKTTHFSDAAFIEYLERTNDIYTQRRTSDGSMAYYISDRSPFGNAIAKQQTSSLMKKTAMTMQPVEGGTLAEPNENLMGPLILESSSGGTLAGAFQLLMVPTSCSHPELAWEFIKFCITPLDEENGEKPSSNTAVLKTGHTRNFPIARANLAAFAEYFRAFGNADFDTYFSKLEERVEEIRELDVYKSAVLSTVWPILEQYYDYGTITAEECAKQMDERLFLYLNE